MVQRYPSAQTFGNSDARMCLQIRLRGRRVMLEISSTATLAVLGLIGLLAAVYLVGTCYIVFRDDMLARLLSNQAETQYAYEDRIVALRAHLDRVATKQLINQDSFEDKVNELISRQSQLETRQAIVNTIWAEAQRQGVSGAKRNASPSSAALSAADETTGSTTRLPTQGLPVTNSLSQPLIPKPLPADPLKTSFIDTGLRLGDTSPPSSVMPDILVNVASGMDRIEQNQILSLSSMERGVQSKIGRWRTVIADIGLDRGRFGPQKKPAEDGVGGPLVPLSPGAPYSIFDRSVSRVQIALGETAHLSTAFGALPLNRPLSGDMAITSIFGARSDPFFHSAAMHTGIDFRGSYGSSVFATAPGKVVIAGSQGGYGNMVEVDHGFGLSTRYAHLSSIDVDVGETVKSGELVGHIGSTGRSTGPHLHYETRIDGEPVDPMRFLQAVSRLGGNTL